MGGAAASCAAAKMQPVAVADVIERLRTIEASAPASDGVACFARLYRAVTENVGADLTGRGFADARFLETLDVTFAGLFFSALESHDRDPGRTPPAWAPLFAQRSRRGIAPLQFALAGMNAHINRDLPVALVAACTEAGIAPATGSPQHADYLRVNTLLATVMDEVKQQYIGGRLARIDRFVHRLDRIDDVVAMWDIARARDAAWTNAEALWALQGDDALTGRFVATLDRTVGLAGRGLLVPADTLLRRFGRLFGR